MARSSPCWQSYLRIVNQLEILFAQPPDGNARLIRHSDIENQAVEIDSAVHVLRECAERAVAALLPKAQP